MWNFQLFFLISNRNFIEGTGPPTKCINYAPRRRDNYIRAIETTKSARDTSEVNPQTRAQSKRRPKNNSPSLVREWSVSSKARLLRSRQTVHIKQRGTRFQTEELCLPKQLNQPKRRSATVLGNTQRTPKTQDQVPQVRSYGAMDQKMVSSFPH